MLGGIGCTETRLFCVIGLLLVLTEETARGKLVANCRV